MKVTKATISKLQSWDLGNRFGRAAAILEDIVSRQFFYGPERVFDAGERGIFIRSMEGDKPTFLGLASLFPGLMCATFTLGLNEVNIKDINKLVKAMQAGI